MPGILKTLPLIAALGLTAPASFAQDTTTQKPEEAATTSEAATAEPGSDLSMGQSEANQTPEPYFKQEFGDGGWKLRCFKVTEGEEPCELYQLLKDDQGTEVAEVALFRLPEGGQAVAGATITVPLETLLTAQLTVAVDGGKGKRYPFSFCSPVGCYARIGFTADDIATFKKGAKATLTLVPAPAPDKKVVLPMSLKGFTAGYAAASVIQN